MLVILLLIIVNTIDATRQDLWEWRCENKNCIRYEKNSDKSNQLNPYPSVETCRLICDENGALWPIPKSVQTNQQFFKFDRKAIKFEFVARYEALTFLQLLVDDYFLPALQNEQNENCAINNTVLVQITVNSVDTNLDYGIDESYKLNITDAKVQIAAPTVYGARNALETLLQLIASYENVDGSYCLVMVEKVQITDAPSYGHRGLLLDPARNFLSIPTIKKHINAMGASKLNVLHLHLTDTQSFPLDIPNVPEMIKYGAYSDDKIYRTSDLEDLVDYAKLRGVRILMEIDAPAHAGNGWQWGNQSGLGDLAVCVNQQPWRSYCIEPPCGQLNPINDNVQKVLAEIYSHILKYVPGSLYFHMGGDEVFIPCWNQTEEIIKYLGKKSRTEQDFIELWSEFQEKALNTFDKVQGDNESSIILWTSDLTNPENIEKYLPKNRYIIQTWVLAGDYLPNKLIDLGYKVIISTKDKWYLDHGFWGTTLYHDWRTIYNNVLPDSENVLGGEVCMWGEYVDDRTVTQRTWPRAAAVAERLWSNPSTRTAVAEQRFYRHRQRLISRGIEAEALTPLWCYQNEGECSR